MTDSMKPVVEDSPLGKLSAVPEQYSPQVLFALPRHREWLQRGLAECPYLGEDIWTAWELSWLSATGVPQVAMADIHIPCDSPSLVESKSLKLYLASLHNKRFDDTQQLETLIEDDLARCTGSVVDVQLRSIISTDKECFKPVAYCIDNAADALPEEILNEGVQAQVLCCTDGAVVEETLVSHLLRTNCPVTGQPDWASVYITYCGTPVSHPSLLAYLVSYRVHQGFHESCIEQIFLDLMERCEPTQLSVYGRYLRRGGIDINPWRSTETPRAPAMRSYRQ